jgi:hypothetical protein
MLAALALLVVLLLPGGSTHARATWLPCVHDVSPPHASAERGVWGGSAASAGRGGHPMTKKLYLARDFFAYRFGCATHGAVPRRWCITS